MVAALPDIGLAAAAALLILLACALWILQRTLGTALGYVPVIGGWIKSHLDAALNDARNAVLSAASSSWAGAVHLINWLSDYLWTTLDRAVEAFGAVAATISHIATVQIPAAIRSGEAYALTRYAAAVAYADTLVRTAETDAARAIASVQAYALNLARAAEGYAAGLAGQAEADARVLFATAEADAAAAVLAADRALSAAISQAQQDAAAAVAKLAAQTQTALSALSRDLATGLAGAQATAAAQLAAVRSGIYTDLGTWADDALRVAWPDAGADLGALRGVIGQDFPWLNDLLGALGGLGAAGLAGALIRSMAGTQAITRLATDCIVPNCRNLSTFGRDLAGLLAGAGDAALVAWIIFMITDPSGWADDTDKLASGLVTATVDAATSLLQAAA